MHFLNDRSLGHILCQCAGQGIVQFGCWEWHQQCFISNADAILKAMSLKGTGTETTTVTDRKKQSLEFVQFVLGDASGGLPLYKQMKTRNRFEYLEMAQIMARFP